MNDQEMYGWFKNTRGVNNEVPANCIAFNVSSCCEL